MNDIKKRTRQSLKDSENECSSAFVKDATSPVVNSTKQKVHTDISPAEEFEKIPNGIALEQYWSCYSSNARLD